MGFSALETHTCDSFPIGAKTLDGSSLQVVNSILVQQNKYSGQVDIMETNKRGAGVNKAAKKVDVLVVGAGIGGMYAIHKFREMGLSVQGIESGGDVGGVWYWNRYPGARCDLMSIDYSYSFSEEIQQEWTWSEQFAAQPEILEYLNFVADKLDLRRGICFNTRVTRAEYRQENSTWLITTDAGDVFEANYCIMATGPLSIPKDPAFPGTEPFQGDIYFAGKWPHEGVDFKGKRVGLVGTGSTGIQITPVVAEQAQSLRVFQRTPSFTLPMHNVELDDEYIAEVKRNYPGLRAAARASRVGGMRPVSSRAFYSIPRSKRLQLMENAWNESGLALLGAFTDLLVNEEANEEVADFVRAKIEQVVDDPDVAEQLKPRGYPIFARRPCLDTHYYEAYNKSHVHLVDCNEEPIESLTSCGLKTTKGEYELDMLIFATGYDSLSGAMLAFDIIGRDGVSLKEKWAHGPVSYMGIVMKDFPNLFSVCGANGPSALANIFTLNEQNVDWIADCVSHMRANGLASAEATAEAEEEWMTLVADLASKTLISKANTWYVGANIEGKPKGLTMYTGGFLAYRQFCDEVVSSGFRGLSFE